MTQEITMRSIELLEEFENRLEHCKQVPLIPNMIMIKKEEIRELIREINISLPEEYQQAKWMKSQQSHIIDDAHMNADHIIETSKIQERILIDEARMLRDNIIKEAEEKAREMVDQSTILEEARKLSNQMIREAEMVSKEIKEGAYAHVQEILFSVRSNIVHIVETVDSNLNELQGYKD